VAAAEIASPLWLGFERLHEAVGEALRRLGDAEAHAVTMTGELADIFPSRAIGVASLCEALAGALRGEIRVYGGRDGWLDIKDAQAKALSVASANWHATASLLAKRIPDALFADMGSTTTDLVPIVAGRVAARGYTDAERLASGELVYGGATRTFLMALAQRVPFRGGWTPVMNEYFASIADVYRILGALPEAADLHPAADGREKTSAASIQRLARMIGRDAEEASTADWQALAGFYAEAQMKTLIEAADSVSADAGLPRNAPLVTAGVGRFVLEKLAVQIGRRCECWEDSVPLKTPEIAGIVSDCAPAAAIALLLAGERS
jgi:probable H4MPT-linked C1 transfer pathway protein